METTPVHALVCGGCAGFAVDVSLYPIDTIKTRLQAPQGFFKAGGFAGIYRGISVAAAGSVPGAALFFSVYESAKRGDHPAHHMAAASVGEIAACLVRVPVEVVKQRMQAGHYSSMSQGARRILRSDGVAGFFRGYGMTVLREIPFAMLQMPLLEFMKRKWADYQGSEPSPPQVAVCGSIAGGVAAAATTPLDVVKTRLMLGADLAGVRYDQGILECAHRIATHEGPPAFFSGVSARVFWISLGGFIFFGAYDASQKLLPSI
ncbi:hypothetical protein CTAYLR_001679 [Chrysophaeum taylorii]|uniref:S-adenosylmethionine transporter n=1 Tax=Chrysophaeum taylorii TaxID=2483200 RepID=A0AAD7XHI3_9STRA|nr:hypothetical protein CTAYLR_001679 [Chrysophaeum taylorii]